MAEQWLEWSRRVAAIAQNGLTYGVGQYDLERYAELREIAMEMMADGAGVSRKVLGEAFCRELGYMTPKVDVRAAVFRDGRILMVQESEDSGWTLPGGWADIGDSPSEVAVRETKEESGYDVKVLKLAALYDRDRRGHPPLPYHVYKIFFLCEWIGGAPAVSTETLAVDFFAEDALPPLSLTRVTAEEIGHMFEHQRNPSWTASFD